MMMGAGLALALVSGSAVLFSVGVFFFNAGFRGFYNASFLSISEVSDKVLRTSSPMVLSIGWALGQIVIALLALFLDNWRIIFTLTLIPLAILFYFIFYHVRDSPRFCVTKHEFATAKAVVEQIAYVNGRPFKGVELREEVEYRTRIENYQQILQGGQFSSRQAHHSYFSLFRFNSIRIRVIFVSIIWSVISLSYFISAKNQLDPSRSYTFNIALAGVIEIVAYLSSVATNINLQRLYVIKRLLIASAVVHLCFYFVHPMEHLYTGGAKIGVMLLEIGIRILMSYGNTFLAIYSIELFPTSIRHFALGMLGFITKLMYMLSFIFDEFFIERYIHPNFVIGILMVGSLFLIPKLRETEDIGIKDNLSEDGDNLLMNETYASIF
jgi:OCT family organic cation transporter-like MFS transporter 4/5